MGGGKPDPSKISPEATKPLPAQPKDRGALMPLHAASVLSWLCSDSTVQSRLGKSKSECYQEIWPVVEMCTSELQAEAPSPENRVASARSEDVLTFRAAYRQCLAQKYADRQQARGIATPSIAEGQPDPLAARMNRQIAQ